MKDDPEFNTHFVHLIEENSCLYDHNHPDYCNREAQDATWEKIAFEVSESVLDCRERWKNIRACYTRYLKVLSESGTGGKYRKPYYLAEYLRFLTPFTKSRKPRNTIPQNLHLTAIYPASHYEGHSEEESEGTAREVIVPEDTNPPEFYNASTQDQSPVFAPLFPKRIKTEHNDSVISEDINGCESNSCHTRKTCADTCGSEDPDFLFLKSILPDMKDMSSAQKRKFKIGILKLAGDIFNETDRSPVPYTHPSSTSVNIISPHQRIGDHSGAV